MEEPALRCLPLCLPPMESPAQKNLPSGRKRCLRVIVIVSFAAIGDMVFGALIGRRLLPLRWFRKAFYPGHVECRSCHFAILPTREHFLRGVARVCFQMATWFPNSVVKGSCRQGDAWLYRVLDRQGPGCPKDLEEFPG